MAATAGSPDVVQVSAARKPGAAPVNLGVLRHDSEVCGMRRHETEVERSPRPRSGRPQRLCRLGRCEEQRRAARCEPDGPVECCGG